jgi:SNF family Na+-dependent transporter
MCDTWSGRAGFILATVGSAVGVGSIWKFPYAVGENGGSAFVLFYFLGLALGSLLVDELGLAHAGAARLRWILRWLVPAGIVAASVAPLFG